MLKEMYRNESEINKQIIVIEIMRFFVALLCLCPIPPIIIACARNNSVRGSITSRLNVLCVGTFVLSGFLFTHCANRRLSTAVSATERRLHASPRYTVMQLLA